MFYVSQARVAQKLLPIYFCLTITGLFLFPQIYLTLFTFMFNYDLIMIYLTAIGLTPGGSSTVHIYTQQYTEQHNSLIRKNAGRAPSLRGIPWHLPYN
jgi:hypothetical protein